MTTETDDTGRVEKVFTVRGKSYTIRMEVPRPEREAMKPIRVMLPAEMAEEARIVATLEDRSRSALMRDALREYLASRMTEVPPLTLGGLAERITGGNVAAMAEMLNDVRMRVKPLNDAGAAPRYDEIEPDASARVDRLAILDLFADHASDPVGLVLREVLNETTGW